MHIHTVIHTYTVATIRRAEKPIDCYIHPLRQDTTHQHGTDTHTCTHTHTAIHRIMRLVLEAHLTWVKYKAINSGILEQNIFRAFIITPTREMSSKVIEIKESKMDKDLTADVQDVVQRVFEDCDAAKERAERIKKELDERFEQFWHVVIGKQFTTWVPFCCRRGSLPRNLDDFRFVTYEESKYCHLVYGGNTAVQIFKCGS